MQIESLQLDSCWKKFISDNRSEIVKISCQNGNEIYHIERYDLFHAYSICYRYLEDIMMIDSACGNVLVLDIKNQNSINVFTNQIFYTHAVQHNMIQIHSSMVDYQSKGILFLGPSGIGKTTQAELWDKYRNALIINGDITFVQETENNFLGWGTPWHGSSPYCENTNVPVHAMIVLKQSPENSIRELTGFEKVTAVSQSVFYPTWMENGMELCLETLDHLLTMVPVYELSCRPDEDAVRLTEETVFGRGVV
mgnify:CR=1 FL=1